MDNNAILPQSAPSLKADPLLSPVSVQVCYITPQAQFLHTILVPQGTTMLQAIALSGVLAAFPEIDPERQKIGVYSKIQSPDTLVREKDRIEIYRSLQVDPMAARRKRAEKRV